MAFGLGRRNLWGPVSGWDHSSHVQHFDMLGKPQLQLPAETIRVQGLGLQKVVSPTTALHFPYVPPSLPYKPYIGGSFAKQGDPTID